MAKKIVTLDQQKHLYQSLSEVFKDQTPAEISEIIKSLGVDTILGDDGELIPVYSLDILSNKPTYVVNDFDIQLTGKVYNYFTDATSKATKWQWERISGNAEEDDAWKAGKTSRLLDLSAEDFTSRFKERDIIFKLSATIGNRVITDEIKFSRFLYFSQVQIIKDGTVFVDNDPETINFTWESNADIGEVRWFVDDVFRSSADTFILTSSEVSLGSAATIRLEATEAVTGEIFTDTETVVRVSNGGQGADGIQGQSVLTSIVFKRSENKPNRPGLGEGDFYNPVPATWSDGIPPELNGWPVWTTTRMFTSDGEPPQGAWTEPEITSDTATVDFDWSNYEGYDLNYLGTPDTNPDLWNEESSVESNWMAVQRTINGEKQPWEISRIKGEKGQPTYTWVKYADDAQGTNMSNLPYKLDGEYRKYIGLAYNKNTSEESEDWQDYTWSLYAGADGIKGETVKSVFAFKRSHTKPAPAVGGNFIDPVPDGAFDGIPPEDDGKPVWMTTSTVSDTQSTPMVWTEWELTSDTSTLDFDWSDYDGYDMDVLGNPDTNPSMWNEESSPSNTYMAIQHIVNGEKQPWEIKRIKGEEGDTLYTWVKFSLYSNGRDGDGNVSMFDDPVVLGQEMIYEGIAVNKPTAQESDIPEDYKWKRSRGKDGASGVSTKHVFAFKRSHTKPATPIGGTYLIPVPSGWFDGIPPESNGMPVWMVSGTVTSDQATPIIWSEPMNTSDTATMDIDWSNYTGSDLDVLGNPDTRPAMWSETSSVSNTYMAIQLTLNGQKQPWEVKKIKGEDGVDGVDGIDGEDGVDGKDGITTKSVFAFKRSHTKPAAASGGTFENPVPVGASDGIPPENDGMPVWMTSGKVTDVQVTPIVWSDWIITSDTATIDFDWSDYEGDDLVYLGNPDSKPSLWNEESSPNSVYMAIQQTLNGEKQPWAIKKIKGEKGEKGSDGISAYVLDLSNDNHTVPALSDGSIPDPLIAFANAKTKATLYYGATQVPLANYEVRTTLSSGIVASAINSNNEVSVTALTADTATIHFEAFLKTGGVTDLTKKVASATFSISKTRNTAVYSIIPSSNVVQISNSILQPSSISARVIMNSGDTNVETFEGILTYRYIFASDSLNDDDGTPINPNTALNLSNAGNPLALEFKYFHPNTGELVDRERVPFVKNGTDGSPGSPGAPGEGAKYQELRFRKSSSFTVAPAISRTEVNPTGWTLEQPEISGAETNWITIATKNADGSLVGQWSVPTRHSGAPGIGTKGDKGDTGDSRFIAPLGPWDSNTQYKGTATRMEAVSYNGSWYTTRIGVGNIPVGTLPTNTTYWNAAEQNFDFIATGLFLADIAYINNLGVRNLKTSDSGTRLIIDKDTNSLTFFSGTSTNPNIKFHSLEPVNSAGDGSVDNHAAIELFGYDGTTMISRISLSNTGGSVIHGQGTNFNSTPSGDTSTYEGNAILHLENTTSTYPLGGFGSAGVAGTIPVNQRGNTTGNLYGGYFDKLLVRGESIRSTSNLNPTAMDGFVVNNTAGPVTLNLPPLARQGSGWIAGNVHKLTVLKSGTGSMSINTTSQRPFFDDLTSKSITGVSKIDLYWDGLVWTMFKTT